MFAGAAREVVFSNPQVVDRINRQFIPVALKAAMVNNPPPGIEGRLYAEIARSRPAPQGICTTNSSGKVLAWVLSFDDDDSILKYLDHVVARYEKFPDNSNPVPAERFRQFPSRKLPDVADQPLAFDPFDPSVEDSIEERNTAQPDLPQGTLVGEIIGRVLDDQGIPLRDTRLQEHYMESRVHIGPEVQQQLAEAVQRASGNTLDIPDSLVSRIVGAAHLGQLDVNPLGQVPGSRNELRYLSFTGRIEPMEADNRLRILVEGRSDVAGAPDSAGNRTDGRLWENRITLRWQGYILLQEDRILELAMVANGQENLRWGNAQFDLLGDIKARHLMAGHRIDLDTEVTYGLFAPAIDNQKE